MQPERAMYPRHAPSNHCWPGLIWYYMYYYTVFIIQRRTVLPVGDRAKITVYGLKCSQTSKQANVKVDCSYDTRTSLQQSWNFIFLQGGIKPSRTGFHDQKHARIWYQSTSTIPALGSFVFKARSLCLDNAEAILEILCCLIPHTLTVWLAAKLSRLTRSGFSSAYEILLTVGLLQNRYRLRGV